MIHASVTDGRGAGEDVNRLSGRNQKSSNPGIVGEVRAGGEPGEDENNQTLQRSLIEYV